MNRHCSSCPKRRRAVWLAVPLTCLLGSLVPSDLVRSDDTSHATVPSQDISGLSAYGTSSDRGDAMRESKRADSSTASNDQGWRATAQDDPKWAKTDTAKANTDESKWQSTPQGAPRWQQAAGNEQPGRTSLADHPLGTASLTDSRPGRSSLHDDHPLGRASIADHKPGRSSVDGHPLGRASIADIEPAWTSIQDGQGNELPLAEEEANSPSIAVVPDRTKADELPQLDQDLPQDLTEAQGPLPLISSQADRQPEVIIPDVDRPKIVSGWLPARDRTAKPDNDAAVEKDGTPDKQAGSQWVSAVESNDHAPTAPAQTESEQAEDWAGHPLAEQPTIVDMEHESFPAPPAPWQSVVPVSGTTQETVTGQHPLQASAHGPALSAQMPKDDTLDLTAPASESWDDLMPLPRTDANQQKAGPAPAQPLESPKPFRLAQQDDESLIAPPLRVDEPEISAPEAQSEDEWDSLLKLPGDQDGELNADVPPLVEPPVADPALAGPGPRTPGALGNDQKLGEAPEDTSLRFLRSQTVLLEPGEWQFDISFQYLNDKNDFVAIRDQNGLVQIGEGETRQRLLIVPLQLRVGIMPDTQAFVNVPFGWSNTETSFFGEDQAHDSGGIGDVSAGLLKQVVVGNEFYPDVLTSVSFSAPTGETAFQTALGTPGSNLGEGFWSASAAITFIQNYDPIVFFYGAGYRYRFENKFEGEFKVDPGNQAFYRFGVGFAVNPNVTLSSSFIGSHIGEIKVNGQNIGGSTQEPMQVRLAATINKRQKSKTHSSVKIVEPFVTFGLNDDALDAIIGITWTH